MSIPQPLSAHDVPDGSTLAAFNTAYERAKQQRVPFVCVARSRGGWSVKADVLTAPGWQIHQDSVEALEAAAVRLVRAGEVRSGSSAGPEYLVLYGIKDEDQARGLAAGIHSALYGDETALEDVLPPQADAAVVVSADVMSAHADTLGSAVRDADRRRLAKLTWEQAHEQRHARGHLRAHFASLAAGDGAGTAAEQAAATALVKLLDSLHADAQAQETQLGLGPW